MLEDKKTKKLKKLLNTINISEKKLSKLNYREKQEYYKAKSKLGTIVFASRDKNGNGLTFRKDKNEKRNNI